MISANALTARIVAAFPDARVTLEDLTGTEDHWKARVITAAFEGKPPLKRHRMVYAALEAELKGPIHALTLEALTPTQAADAPTPS